MPKPSDIEIHPSAVRDLITNVASALRRDVPDGREALRRYLGTVTMRPVEEAGSRYYVAEGTWTLRKPWPALYLGTPAIRAVGPGLPICRWERGPSTGLFRDRVDPLELRTSGRAGAG